MFAPPNLAHLLFLLQPTQSSPHSKAKPYRICGFPQLKKVQVHFDRLIFVFCSVFTQTVFAHCVRKFNPYRRFLPPQCSHPVSRFNPYFEGKCLQRQTPVHADNTIRISPMKHHHGSWTAFLDSSAMDAAVLELLKNPDFFKTLAAGLPHCYSAIVDGHPQPLGIQMEIYHLDSIFPDFNACYIFLYSI